MKSKWPVYTTMLVVTATIVTVSLFLPQILLEHQEARMLGVDSYQPARSYPGRLFPKPSCEPAATPSPAATGGTATATPQGSSFEDIMGKVRLLENGSENTTRQNEPSQSELTMKQAVNRGMEQITAYGKAGAMLPLGNFPDDYSVNAKLYTMQSMTGITMDYWSIKFASKSQAPGESGGVSLTMDAQTGTLLSYNMSVNAQQQPPDLIAGITYLAASIGLDGSILEVKPADSAQETATWASGNHDLFMTLTCSSDGSATALSMNLSTKTHSP